MQGVSSIMVYVDSRLDEFPAPSATIWILVKNILFHTPHYTRMKLLLGNETGRRMPCAQEWRDAGAARQDSICSTMKNEIALIDIWRSGTAESYSVNVSDVEELQVSTLQLLGCESDVSLTVNLNSGRFSNSEYH